MVDELMNKLIINELINKSMNFKMKICVVSDSHTETKNLQKVIDKAEFDVLIHLGDDYGDTDKIKITTEFIRVPGVYDKEYFDKTIDGRIIKKFGKFRFLLTHTVDSHENDSEAGVLIKPEDLYKEGKVDAVLFGHTHIPEIFYRTGKYDHKIRLRFARDICSYIRKSENFKIMKIEDFRNIENF